jgi:hypothetical protein
MKIKSSKVGMQVCTGIMSIVVLPKKQTSLQKIIWQYADEKMTQIIFRAF